MEFFRTGEEAGRDLYGWQDQFEAMLDVWHSQGDGNMSNFTYPPILITDLRNALGAYRSEFMQFLDLPTDKSEILKKKLPRYKTSSLHSEDSQRRIVYNTSVVYRNLRMAVSTAIKRSYKRLEAL